MYFLLLSVLPSRRQFVQASSLNFNDFVLIFVNTRAFGSDFQKATPLTICFQLISSRVQDTQVMGKTPAITLIGDL